MSWARSKKTKTERAQAGAKHKPKSFPNAGTLLVIFEGGSKITQRAPAIGKLSGEGP